MQNFSDPILIGTVTYKRVTEIIYLVQQVVAFTERRGLYIVFNNRQDDKDKLLMKLKDFDKDILVLESKIVNSTREHLDFSSLDKLITLLKSKKSGIVLISNEENIGGSGGIAAIQYLFRKLPAYKHLWLIDDEMDVNKETLFNLLAIAKSSSKIGIVGSTLIYQGKILEAGSSLSKKDFEFLPKYHGYPLAKFIDAIGEKKYDEVEYVSFASVLLSKKCVNKIGILKNFFIHVDDAEYCFRARKYGFKVIVSYKSIANTRVVNKPSSYSLYDLRNFLFLSDCYYSLKQKIRIHLNLFRKLLYSLLYNKKAFHLILKAYWLFLQKKYGKVG